MSSHFICKDDFTIYIHILWMYNTLYNHIYKHIDTDVHTHIIFTAIMEEEVFSDLEKPVQQATSAYLRDKKVRNTKPWPFLVQWTTCLLIITNFFFWFRIKPLLINCLHLLAAHPEDSFRLSHTDSLNIAHAQDLLLI